MDELKDILTELEKDGKLTNYITSGAKELAKKLNAEIEKGNMTAAFSIALGLAILKDSIDIIIDILLIGEIPGVGYIPGALTIFLYYFMLGKGWFLKWRIRAWFWILGFFIDGLPLFNALPINSLLVIYAWRITVKRAKKAKLKMKDLDKLSRREINALNADISILEESYESESNSRRRGS